MSRSERSLFVLALLAAILVVVSTPAQATLLSPGGNVVPGSADASGTILADTGLEAFSFAGASGTVRELVVMDSLNPFCGGCVSFLIQVHETTLTTQHVSIARFDGFSTDVSQFAPHSPFITAGTVAAGSADRTGDGNVVEFNFTLTGTGVDSTDTTLAFIIRTNATQFTTGTIGVMDDGSQTLAGFAPTAVPEPATLLLLGSGLLAPIGTLRRRLRRPLA